MNSCNTNPTRISKDQALLLPDAQKREYFKHVLVRHERVSETLQDLEAMATPESGTDIALLIGPSGVGKSALTHTIKERLLTQYQAEMNEDLSFIPVIRVEAPSSGERGFSWRLFYIGLGQALNEPLMEKKIEERSVDGRLTVRPINAGATVAGLRMAVEDALRLRRTILVIVDEAVHLLRHAKGNTLASHMDALKSLANICGVTLLLVGSYDLLQLMKLSGQVARRSAILHFPRYCSGVRADEQAFKKTLQTLQKYLPISTVPDLSPLAGDLMHSCLGCVGILKDTLAKALTFALMDGGKWTDKCLQKAILSDQQIVTLLEETLEGERSIAGSVFGSGSVGWRPPERKAA